MRAVVFGAVVRFAVFAVVCVVAAFAMVVVFGQIRFGEQRTYRAEFTSVTGLEEGNFVRIAGVEVGTVERISITGRATAIVEFTTDEGVVLTHGTRVGVRYENLVGGRYMALEAGTGGVETLRPGQLIPIDHTAPALDLDALIGGFKPLFRALDPDQVNALSIQLVRAFQGEGPTIGSVLQQTAVFTNTLADRDELIGQVITNLNTVLGTLGDQSKQFDEAVTSLSELVNGLAQRRHDLATSLAYTDAASSSIAELLDQARPPLKKMVHETDRSSGQVLLDHEYFDQTLATLPDAYRILARQGLYGDFFNFYTCETLLKLNGKGGQPVYIRIGNQPTGRCAPK